MPVSTWFRLLKPSVLPRSKSMGSYSSCNGTSSSSCPSATSTCPPGDNAGCIYSPTAASSTPTTATSPTEKAVSSMSSQSMSCSEGPACTPTSSVSGPTDGNPPASASPSDTTPTPDVTPTSNTTSTSSTVALLPTVTPTTPPAPSTSQQTPHATSTSGSLAPTIPSAASSTQVVSSNASGLSHSDKTKAIIGGAVGGAAFLVLAFLVLFFRKSLRRRLKRMRGHNIAPSAEFMHSAALSPTFHDRSFSTSPRPLLRQGSSTLRMHRADEQPYSDQPPPPFTPGAFTDRVIEKVHSAAQQRQEHLNQPSAYDATRKPNESIYSSVHSSTSFHTYEVDDHTLPSTSPILPEDSDLGHQSSMGHGQSFGGARPRASESAEGGVPMGWAI